MFLQINPALMIPKYITYILQDGEGRDIFTYYCKFVDVLKLHDLVKNPAADIKQTYNLYVVGYYDTMREAQNAHSALVQQRGQPVLLQTHFFNALGSIRCNETGEVWRNQADLVRAIGCDSSALSRHLKRQAGFATIKGHTYSRAAYLDGNKKTATLEPSPLYQTRPRNKWIKCETTGVIYRTQREACKACSINPGQLSQHLQKHAGYKTVKGLKFSYCESQDKPPQAVYYPPRA